VPSKDVKPSAHWASTFLHAHASGRARRGARIVLFVVLLAALAAPLWSPYAAVGVSCAAVAGLVLVVRAATRAIVSRDLRVAHMLSERNSHEQDVARERASLVRALEHSASHDRLTMLLNREAFSALLDTSLGARPDGPHTPPPVTVMFLDISRFADLNVSLGPALSDELLVKVAQRISAALRPGDLLARIDGDVFAVLLETVAASSALDVAQRLLRTIQASYDIDGRLVVTTFACGLATAAAGEDVDAVEMLRRAGLALRTAKTTRGGCVSYEPRIEAETEERRVFDEDLRQALPSGQLHLVYQPLVDTHTGEVTAVEALMRWNHPQRGAVPPSEFIPVAESSGHIVDIGLWALKEACRQQRAWREEHGIDVMVAVNLSARQLSDPDVVERVRVAVLRQAVDPRRIKLEITESLLVDDMPMAVDVLTRLRALGLRLSIDDFGTGYSSLSRLGELPIDEIKIDKFFVDGIGKEGTRETILNAAIAMGHGLGLTVVAEGVETVEQLEYLRAHNCDYTQGFLLSRPVAAADALALLRGPLEPPPAMPRQRESAHDETDAIAVPQVFPSLAPRPSKRLFAR
jgi:diguanylate cyclase (GGDEF)-like protein